MWPFGPVAAGLLAAAVLAPSSSAAQESAAPLPTSVGPLAAAAARRDAPLPPITVERATGSPWSPAPSRAPRRQSAPHPSKTMSASLLVPGLGQRMLGQRRAWVYAGLELVGWALYVERRRAGGDFRDRYRDLAWDVARIQAGPRVDGAFSYYETLTEWTRSGAFDADAGSPGLQPESDATTFNGSIWQRASGLFLPDGPGVPTNDPGYVRALEYYTERAYGPDFLWDWTGTGDARRDFGELIHESDERFRQATNLVGAVLANHVVSAIDAYLSARGLGARLDVGVAPSPHSQEPRWTGHVTVRAPG